MTASWNLRRNRNTRRAILPPWVSTYSTGSSAQAPAGRYQESGFQPHFGKDIIPTLLAQDKALYAYKFKGYWKDVGTIDSLWEANMDLLSPNSELDLNDPTWKIYTEDATSLPQYICDTAVINTAFITQGWL